MNYRDTDEIAVFGSINMDLVLNLEDFPQPGQTIKASNFDKSPGGKGANQAVAAAGLGGEVSMYGALGDDNDGDVLRESLKNSGVKTGNIAKRSSSSGLAFVLVDKNGENEIVIVSGANGTVRSKYAENVFEPISKSKILLLQLETPLTGIKKLLNLLPDQDWPKVILDPAPATPLDKIPLQKIDILTPNEEELMTIASNTATDAAIKTILSTETTIILKRGEDGAEYIAPGSRFHVPAYDVKVEDTTGAGDAFNGALAVALSNDYETEDAIKFASAAGAIATKDNGAQSSIPTLDSVKKLMRKSD